MSERQSCRHARVPRLGPVIEPTFNTTAAMNPACDQRNAEREADLRSLLSHVHRKLRHPLR